ncbi:sensor histidine kinase [Maricaulis salignorans]|uniref:sensor histidine kinase n=1 Tax=Maricaulis salignorans TaxID=144026 RepID=UPI003A8F1880
MLRSLKESAPQGLTALRSANQHLIIVLAVFWGVAAFLSLVMNWTQFSASPTMLIRLLPVSLAGGFLCYLLAELIRRTRGQAWPQRLSATALGVCVAALVYSIVRLTFLAENAVGEFDRGMLGRVGQQWLTEVGLFAAWCGLALLLGRRDDAAATSNRPAMAGRRSRIHRMLNSTGLPAPLMTGRNDGINPSTLWRFQLAFWLCNLFFTFLSSVAVVEELSNLWRNVIIESSGLAVTILIHVAVLRPTRQLDLPIRFGLALGSSMLATCFYIVVMWLMWFEVFPAGFSINGLEPRGWAGLTAIAPRWFVFNMPIFIAWSAIYLVLESFGRIRAQERQIFDSAVLAQEAQLKMLRFQLNPHFLFNTINAISSLVIDNRNDEAETMLGRLSGFLRFALQTSPNDQVTLQQELEAQALYLAIEKARFDSRLEVEHEIEPGVQRALLPSLILQPVLENSVKYAVSRSRSRVKVLIRARRLGDDLLVEILDSGGPGMPPSESTGVGLANIRARLDVLYGERAQLEAGPVDTGGFAVRIRLPIELAPEDDDAGGDAKHAHFDR